MEGLKRMIYKEICEEDKILYEFEEPPIEEPKITTGEKLDISFPFDDVSVEEDILEPFKYSMTAKGKNLRSDLITSVNKWFKAPAKAVRVLMETVYMFHNYSLMVDDIQDRSVLRRGSPCAYLVYGIPRIINTTDFLLAQTYVNIGTLEKPKLFDVCTRMYEDSLRGQALEIHWRDNFICPTEREYKEMVLKKTGSLFRGIMEFLQVSGDTNMDVRALKVFFVLYFQINDDYQNLTNEGYHKKKGFCEDITEGKFSFPVVYVVNNYPEEGKKLINILRQHTHDLELLKHAKSIIENCGALEYTRNILKVYREKVYEESKKLGPNPDFEKRFLNKFLDPDTTIDV